MGAITFSPLAAQQATKSCMAEFHKSDVFRLSNRPLSSYREPTKMNCPKRSGTISAKRNPQTYMAGGSELRAAFERSFFLRKQHRRAAKIRQLETLAWKEELSGPAGRSLAVH
jgi:hypothetical protein